ncbi:MAG: hypothetical protein KDA42_06955 [Planctomycetales bacterium]|nr:hypothetical protein [Planctomycetales bacterium]
MTSIATVASAAANLGNNPPAGARIGFNGKILVRGVRLWRRFLRTSNRSPIIGLRTCLEIRFRLGGRGNRFLAKRAKQSNPQDSSMQHNVARRRFQPPQVEMEFQDTFFGGKIQFFLAIAWRWPRRQMAQYEIYV